jgi:hypothetical protein
MFVANPEVLSIGSSAMESGFALALTVQHPTRRSERSTGVCRVYCKRNESSVAREEVHEEESAGSPGVRWAPGGC